jgi:hypothetical protein
MAIRHGMLVAANLPQVVWRALVAHPVTLEDLRAIDLATAEAIDRLAGVVEAVCAHVVLPVWGCVVTGCAVILAFFGTALFVCVSAEGQRCSAAAPRQLAATGNIVLCTCM